MLRHTNRIGHKLPFASLSWRTQQRSTTRSFANWWLQINCSKDNFDIKLSRLAITQIGHLQVKAVATFLADNKCQVQFYSSLSFDSCANKTPINWIMFRRRWQWKWKWRHSFEWTKSCWIIFCLFIRLDLWPNLVLQVAGKFSKHLGAQTQLNKLRHEQIRAIVIHEQHKQLN